MSYQLEREIRAMASIARSAFGMTPAGLDDVNLLCGRILEAVAGLRDERDRLLEFALSVYDCNAYGPHADPCPDCARLRREIDGLMAAVYDRETERDAALAKVAELEVENGAYRDMTD